MCLLLVLVTIVQMLYMDTVRVRAKEMPLLELFRAGLDERLGLRPDEGILTFSLLKHTMLALLGAFVYRVSGGLGEACLFSWAAMLGATYIIPQFLYRRTSGKWFSAMIPLTRALIYMM